MSEEFLVVFDQLRSVFGLLLACILFCEGAVARKKIFLPRLAAGCAVCAVQAILWLPLYRVLKVQYMQAIWLGYLHVIACAFLVLMLICSCYEIGFVEALFRCTLGKVMEITLTALLRNAFVEICFPDLPMQRFGVYVCVVDCSIWWYLAVFICSLSAK